MSNSFDEFSLSYLVELTPILLNGIQKNASNTMKDVSTGKVYTHANDRCRLSLEKVTKKRKLIVSIVTIVTR